MRKPYILAILAIISASAISSIISCFYFGKGVYYYVMIEKSKVTEAYAYEWNFDVEKSALGWIATHGFSEFQLTEEGLMAVVIGFDPYIHSPRVNIVAEKQFKVIVLAKIIGNASMLKLYILG